MTAAVLDLDLGPSLEEDLAAIEASRWEVSIPDCEAPRRKIPTPPCSTEVSWDWAELDVPAELKVCCVSLWRDDRFVKLLRLSDPVVLRPVDHEGNPDTLTVQLDLSL